MADAFTINFTGVEELKKKFEQAPEMIKNELSAKIYEGGNKIATMAKSLAPANVGFLRNMISNKKIPAPNIGTEITSGAEYSAFVEFGTGTHFSAASFVDEALEGYAAQFKGAKTGSSLSLKEAIYTWAKQKGIDPKLWYVIYRSIAQHGIYAHPFFFPAVKANIDAIQADIQKTVDKIL